MSAAYWRKAMNFGAAAPARIQGQTTVSRPIGVPAENRGLSLIYAVRARHVAVLVVLLAFPWLATPFLTYQIGSQ